MADIQSSGGWVEVVAPGIKTTLDASTMPHQLISKADGTFTFEPVSWEKREVGDDVTNPVPSFVGNRINDVFFTRNRLGFLTSENVVMSRAGGAYFNFSRETVTDVLDTDPIDLAADEGSLSVLTEAIPFNEDIVVFSPTTQFRFTSGDEPFTARSVKMRSVSRYENYSPCAPVASGTSIHFATSHGSYGGISEFRIAGPNAQAQDLTEHVPRYIPGNIRKILTCDPENMLVALSDYDLGAIYVYSSYSRGEERLQASWSRWAFGPNDRVLDAAILSSDLVLLIQRPDGLYLETLTLATGIADASSNCMIHLDRRLVESVLARTYFPGTNQTYVSIPWEWHGDTERPLEVWERLPPGETRNPVKLNHTMIAPTMVAVDGDVTDTQFFIGAAYDSAYTFSTQYLRDDKGSRTDGRLQMRRFHAQYARTGKFSALVAYTRTARNISGGGATPTGLLLVDDGIFLTEPLSGLWVDFASTGSDDFTLSLGVAAGTKVRSYSLPNDRVNASGRFTWPIHAKADSVSVSIRSSGALPFAILSAGWEAGFTARAQKV